MDSQISVIDDAIVIFSKIKIVLLSAEWQGIQSCKKKNSYPKNKNK